MKKKSSLNLGIEIVAILAVFIMSISILSKAFVSARTKSVDAAVLSDAVTLASNGADVFLSCVDEEEICRILNENGNAQLRDKVSVCYDNDLKADASGAFRMDIITEENDGFVDARIIVYHHDELIYEITTGRQVER